METGIIEGAVYDPYEAAITNVRISLENTSTGEVINLRTEDRGRYSTRVQAGRYRVKLHPSVGYPVGYEHSPFTISAGEKVSINFRPKPSSISSSIEGGHWIEKYVGAFPSEAAHFIRQRDGAIKELRIQYQRVKARNSAFEYTASVTASFGRFTVYADRVIFDTKRGKLTAEGDVLFEDGDRARKARRAEIDLLTNGPVIATNAKKS